MTTRERRANDLGVPIVQIPDRRGKGRHASGRDHYRWNCGQMTSEHGYVKVRVGKGHPLADPNGYAYEHLLVWVNAGNERPKPDEVIHHINDDKTDNRIENLRLDRRSNHSIGHNNALSDPAVRMVREMYFSGSANMPQLAVRFGVPVSRISKIIRGKTRLSAGGPISINNRGNAKKGRVLDGQTYDEYPQA